MVEVMLQARGMHKFIDGYEGELWRKSQLSGDWKKRYFTLKSKKINCFEDATCGKLVSELIVYNDIILYDIPGSAENRNFLFYFSVGVDDVYYLSAENDDIKQNWLEAITDAKHNGFKLMNLPKLAIEPFYPSIDLCLSFQNETYFANNENRILPANIQDPPAVTLRFGSEHSIYTLVMIDLDSIRTSFEPNASYLHWAIVNIEGTDISSGLEISHYEGPSPEYDSGMHRFMFLLFNQSSDFTPDEFDALDEMFSHRGNFSHIELMQRFHLGVPVGINGFYAAWDDTCDLLHETMGYTPPPEYFSHKQAAIAEKTRTENARRALFQDFTLSDVFPPTEMDPTEVPALGTIALRIRYDRDHIVHNGLAIQPEFTKKQPNVSYLPHPVESEKECGLYTLLLIDPDAPSRINHSLREHVSWVVVNIPQDKVIAGETVLAYQAPAPSYASGLHRYIFCLYKQKVAFTPTQVEENHAFFVKRSGILTYTWVKSQNEVLESVPVSLEAFLSEWDKSVDELHRDLGYTPPPQYLSPTQKRQALASTAQKSATSMFSPRNSEADDITVRLKKIQEAHQTFNTTVTGTSTRMTDLEVELEGKKKRLEIEDASEESTAVVPHIAVNDSPASRLEQGPASRAPSGPSSGAKKGPPRGPITLSAAAKTISSAQNSPINLHALGSSTEAQSAAAAAAALNSTDDAVVEQSRQESSKSTISSSQRAEYTTENTGHTKTSSLKKHQSSDGQVSEERTEEEREEKHQERSEKMSEEYTTNEVGRHSTSVRDYSPDAQNSPLSAVTMLKQEQGVQEEARRLQQAQLQQRQQELLERQHQERELQENARKAQEEKVLKQQQDTMERQRRVQEEEKEQHMRDYNKPYRASRQQRSGKEFFSALPDSEYSDTDASAYDSSSVFSGPTPTGRYGFLQPQHSGSNTGNRAVPSMASQQQSQGHAARGAALTPEADDRSQTEYSETSGHSGNQQHRSRNDSSQQPEDIPTASTATSKRFPGKLSSDPTTRVRQINEGVVQAKSTSDLCELFGITTQSVFSGEKMKKKLSNDFMSKDSFIWISPRTRSLHWCKAKGDASDSKFLLLDPVGGADPGTLPKGEPKGTVKRVRVSGPNLLVTMESGEFLELKLSAEGTPAAVTRAADWAAVIKAFSPSSS